MRRKGFHIILLLLTTILVSSCSLKRYVPEGQYIVWKNRVNIDSTQYDVSKSSLSDYISLKPRRSIITINFKPWAYYISQDKTGRRFWKWVNETIGEEPTYYDINSVEYSSRQMEKYLNHVGHFNSKVTSELETKRFKAFVTYNVKLAKPYTINAFNYDIPDTTIAYFLKRIEPNYPLKEGDVYDEYKLNKIRDQITEHLRNRGYYFFNRDYITYEVDSNFHNHTLSVKMKIADAENRETGAITPHKRYIINSINICPNYSPLYLNSPITHTDTIITRIGRRSEPNQLNFFYYGKAKIKPQTFSQAIQIQKGRPYSLNRVTQTYNALGNFKAFSNVNITFDTVANDSLNLLDCRITMQQVDRHSYTLQLEGTRAESDLGIKGGLSYTNKNLFRGAEIFQLSLRGGIEAQQVITIPNDIDLADSPGSTSTFNTKEFSLTGSLTFPKFLSPFPLRNFVRDYQPKTTITLGFNDQKRYYYTRYIVQASYGYDWKSSFRFQHFLTPIYLNTVKITDMNILFFETLAADPNQRRKDQYTDHLIFGLRYSFVYNTQNINKETSFTYLRVGFESSGNLISLFNNTRLINYADSHHELFGIRYAQFVRTDVDFRQHIKLNDNSWLVFREFLGLGLPYGNSLDMPFERSFYAGGTNGMRGWRYRTLGPGAYKPTEDDIEQIGDMQLELNAEYRFTIYNSLKGAAFADAGNIWTYHPNSALPEGNFRFDTFYKQLAMDVGFGLRFDIKFIVVRADLALALLYPYKDETGSRILLNPDNNWTLNIGIGYPF